MVEPVAVGGALGLAALWRVLAVVVYRDAVPESRKRAMAWMVVVLVFGAAGLAAYGLDGYLPIRS